MYAVLHFPQESLFDTTHLLWEFSQTHSCFGQCPILAAALVFVLHLGQW